MTALVGLKSGHDVRYFTSSEGKGCAGAMRYYTEGGEPAGRWHGRAAAGLGLAGAVDAEVIDKLYMDCVGPDGAVLARKRGPRDGDAAEQAAVRDFEKAHGGYASVTEVGEHRARERAKSAPKSVPYFDQTVNAVKSVSVLHASYRLGAVQARKAGNRLLALYLDGRADAIERALMDAAMEAVDWLEAHHARTRTGYHSKTTGEWRDGAGLTAALFLHHLSRDGDPQLHVHIAIWNRVQRADGADDKWRTLYGRDLYQNKLGLAALVDRFTEQRLRRLGYVMVPRKDGNGCEVAGVDAAIMKQFSSRAVAVDEELARLAAEYELVHGRRPSVRTLWLLHQQAGQNTRRLKSQARKTVNGRVHRTEPTAAQRLEAYEQACTDAELHAMSTVWPAVERTARAAERERGGAAPSHGAGQGGAGRGAVRGAAGGADDGGAGGAGVPPPLAPVPDAELDDDELCRLARIAVANVQQRHGAWTWAQLRFEAHRALPPGGTPEHVDLIAGLAVSGRAGTNVVQVGAAPDVTDVSRLGVRATDGGSVFRPPNEERWCTIGHLDLEAWIAGEAQAARRQLITEAAAREAVAGTDLTEQQAEAVVAMLTTGQATVALDAAAGSGKSHTVAVFAELWTRLTGGRVIGLTTSTNAARVLQGELDEQVTTGLAETYNIAQFLGKVEGSARLRRPIPVHERDVLVVDEATQCSTEDMAAILQSVRESGARMYPVGDTAQLGAVDAGGIFALLAEMAGGPKLTEVLRFRNAWELAASLRLRRRDAGVFAVYDRRGRIRGADHESMFDAAAWAYLGHLLRGRDVLLLAGSNAEASELARRVQAQLIKLGRVQDPEVDLADGNRAGVGDRLRARHNTRIWAHGQNLTNRDTIRVAAVEPDRIWAERRTGPDSWTERFEVSRAYLAEHAELDYAGNVHVAQGRTVDVGLLAVTPSLDRRGLLVGMTRGRWENVAHVETGNTAPAGQRPYEQATPEQVLASVLDRDSDELSATATLRAGQDWAWGMGHVMHLWSVAMHRTLDPRIDVEIVSRLSSEQARKFSGEFAREALHNRLREAQLAGHDVGELIARIMADSLDGARSVASVLHSRLTGLGLGTRHDVSWAQRTPDGAPQMARDLAEGMDARCRVLGERAAERPEPWVTRHLGAEALGPGASPALRAEWERRAGAVAAYREAAGITDPHQAVAAEPHAGNPELETARRAAIHALEIRDEAEILAGMSRGQLEAAVAEGDRAVAAAPADVSARLRHTGQASADTWAQAAAARVAGRAADADDAEALARDLDGEHRRLNTTATAYELWSDATGPVRERAAKAAAELARRQPDVPDGQDPDAPEGEDRESLADWWRAFDEAAGRVEAALDAEAAGRVEPEPDDEPAAAEDPESLAAWWREVMDGPAVASDEPGQSPTPEPATAGGGMAYDSGPAPAAAGSDTPPGPGRAPAASAAPDAENPGDPSPAGVGEAGAGQAPAARGAQDNPPPPEPEPADVSAAQTGPDEARPSAARLDALQAQAEAAADRAQAGREAADASSDYAARTAEAEREAEAEAGAGGWQARLSADEMEPEA